MKSILISVKPKWVAKILNGEKTIEIRKTMPKCDLPIDVYIYCTKDKKYSNLINRGGFLTGMVVAKFTLNKVEEIIPFYDRDGEYDSGYFTETLGVEEFKKVSCIDTDDLADYLDEDYKTGYAIHISDLEIFDKPKELSEFKRSVWLRNEYISPNPICDMCKSPNCKKCERHYCLVPLTKAPQSWCYIEVE